jgi:hypothetical protein
MSEERRDDAALDADLASLRSALREVGAPDDGDGALLSAYRARLAARAPSAAAGPAARGSSRAPFMRRPLALAAAALLVVVTAIVALRVERAERGEAAASPGAPTAAASAQSVAAEPLRRSAVFRPLPFARGVSAVESYSVVRVRIRLPTSAPGVGAPPDAAIEADLLVGEDGLARAIRFDDADTLFVSTVSDQSGERR